RPQTRPPPAGDLIAVAGATILPHPAPFACARCCGRCGCPGCSLNTTEHPAASDLAVSPPAVENANGKLLAPNTATGPIPLLYYRISALAAPSPLSIRASA